MKMPDSNTSLLSAHEAKEDARQKSYDSLLPEAEKYLREWVRDGETIGKPRQFEKLSPFLLADLITEEPTRYGLDAEFIVNAICLGNWVSDDMHNLSQRVGDNAYDTWRLSDAAEDYINDVVDWLEECAREEYED